MAQDIQRKVNDFVNRYPLDFIFDYERAEQLAKEDPGGKNILRELNQAIDQYIVFSSSIPSPPHAMVIQCALWINRAFSYGVLKDKNLPSNRTKELRTKSDIKREQLLFLQKLYEKAGYNPSKSVDANVSLY